MCMDYRALNKITMKNSYPLPKIQECLDQIGSVCFFSKINFLSGYWQICIMDNNTVKTVFNTWSTARQRKSIMCISRRFYKFFWITAYTLVSRTTIFDNHRILS